MMNYLDEIASEYHNIPMKDKFIEDESQVFTLNWINTFIDDGLDVLELGYGEGILTNHLSKLSINLEVLEGSKILVDKALKKHQNTVFHHSFFENFEAKKKYDLIICTHVLEHVDDPVLVLNNMREWLNPNGKVIIIVPNADSIHRQLAVIMKLQGKRDDLSKRDHIVGHKRVYDHIRLEADILKASLSIVERKGFFLKTIPNSMMLNYDLGLIKALNKISDTLPFNILANLAYVVEK